jgi:nuclear pore complex protein Nup133
MFSPEASVQGSRSSLRNPRRRQRKDSDGPQQTRRKRTKLSEDAFQPNGDAHVNGNGSATPNGHGDHSDADGSLVLVHMPVREKQLASKRAVKEDAAQYLVS